MNKFLISAVGALVIGLGIAPASAADLAARPYTKAPPMVAAIYDWSGFYIGANLGVAGDHSKETGVTPNSSLSNACFYQSNSVCFDRSQNAFGVAAHSILRSCCHRRRSRRCARDAL